MASQEFDNELFERKLQMLKDSQESIQSLSAWCLERRAHHKRIVSTWLQVLKKVKVEHRLTLFYLANDVIQYSKRKNYEFVESWGTTLQRATTMVRDEKVKHRILRIFKIWDQRHVYDEEFLADLSGLISAAPKKKVEPQIQQPEEFQASILISTMRSCATLELATDSRLRDLRHYNINIENAEELCSSLKDRRRVEDAEKQVDNAAKSVESYVKALEAEIGERKQVLDLLFQADQFYETQRSEVKIVVNAYRNFGNRVKNLKKKLDEILPMLVSPLPSPDVNAPSPSPDSDIELPEDSLTNIAPPTMYGSFAPDYNPALAVDQNSSYTNNFTSFIGGNVDFDMRSVFSENSGQTDTKSRIFEAPQPQIEILDPPPPPPELDDTPPTFLKTVTPSEPACNIPGLGDASDVPNTSSDFVPVGLNLKSVNPLLMGVPGTPISSNLSDNQINHSTPLIARTLNSDSPYSNHNSQSSLPLSTDQSNVPAIVSPLLPPPLPPIFLDDESPCYNNKLPPKFPTWTFPNDSQSDPSKGMWEEPEFTKPSDSNAAWPGNDTSNDQWDMSNEALWPGNVGPPNNITSETPESPPLYEKTLFNRPREYNDTQIQEPILSSVGDVDHRVIAIPMEKQVPLRLMKGADVDHRNLISLTGSPANNSNDALGTPNCNDNLWSNTDQDYRRQHTQPGDNVESIDMEMSDEEGENKKCSRTLVDVRPHDRDMRLPMPGAQMGDMDMRMLPSGTINVSRSHGSQNAPPFDAQPPPPPLPPFLQNAFNEGFEDDDYGPNDFGNENRDFEFYDNNSSMPRFPNMPRGRNMPGGHRPRIHEEEIMSSNQPVLSTDMVILNDGDKSFPPPPAEKPPLRTDEECERLQESIMESQISQSHAHEKVQSTTNNIHSGIKEDWPLKNTVDPPKQTHKLNNIGNAGSFLKDNRASMIKGLMNKIGAMKASVGQQKSENSQFNGPQAMTPADQLRASMIAEYEQSQRVSQAGSMSNPYSWRGNSVQRGRMTTYRGGPRLPWVDRPPRGMMVRGKPRGLYRGSFRGRGRGNNMW